MTNRVITVVRVYLAESEHRLQAVFDYLHDEAQVRGVTVFRGISGFGKSGMVHDSNLLDLSMDLPLVVEFFDLPDKIDTILSHLETLVDPGHIITWSAKARNFNNRS